MLQVQLVHNILFEDPENIKKNMYEKKLLQIDIAIFSCQTV